MRLALDLAEKGQGWTSPNPVVGAVVEKDGEIIGQGYHEAFGKDHAEVVALKEAGERARGATLYVNLEPCDHHGKTPPCTDAILASGIQTLVIGAEDPNPMARGGAERLEKEGLKVFKGVLAETCLELNAPFYKATATGRPFVSAKWAMSLDGRIATSTRDSKWITSELARQKAHQLRAEHDAVLIGIETMLADNPRMNVRRTDGPTSNGWQPKRIILDSQARTPTDAMVWDVPGGEIMIFVSEAAPQEKVEALALKGAEIVGLTPLDGRLPVDEVLKVLFNRGILSLFVEGGSRVLGSFFDIHAVDRVYTFIAPIIIGGEGALSPVGGHGPETVDSGLPVSHWNVEKMSVDLLATGRIGNWHWLQG